MINYSHHAVHYSSSSWKFVPFDKHFLISPTSSPWKPPSPLWFYEFDFFRFQENVLNIYNGIKKKEILPFVTTWMNLEDIMLHEITQTPRSKYSMILLIHGS